MAKLTKSDITKKALIAALESTLGVVTSACKKVGISRETYYQYYRSDKKFKKAVDSVQDIAIDFAESKLFEEVRDNNITAIIFYLKTKGKGRGYSEKHELAITELPDGFDTAGI